MYDTLPTVIIDMYTHPGYCIKLMPVSNINGIVFFVV